MIAVEDEDEHWCIRIHEDQIALEDLLSSLCSFGARISLFQPAGMDMEEAFMKLTMGTTA